MKPFGEQALLRMQLRWHLERRMREVVGVNLSRLLTDTGLVDDDVSRRSACRQVARLVGSRLPSL